MSIGILVATDRIELSVFPLSAECFATKLRSYIFLSTQSSKGLPDKTTLGVVASYVVLYTVWGVYSRPLF